MSAKKPRVQTAVRLSEQQLIALKKFAEADHREVSQVIRIAIDEFFERHIEQKAASR